jgi:hypothetical protein
MTINEQLQPPPAPAGHAGGHSLGGHCFGTVSTHSTSEGRIAYQRCSCGLWRIQRHPAAGGFPVSVALADEHRGRGRRDTKTTRQNALTFSSTLSPVTPGRLR